MDFMLASEVTTVTSGESKAGKSTMYRWQHRKESSRESTAKAEVSAWLENVGDELDQNQAVHEVDLGLNLYGKTGAADELGLEPSLEAHPTPARNESG